MNNVDGRGRPGIVDTERPRARSVSPVRGSSTQVSKGSDAFREAMQQVYTDMREQKRQDRLNSEEGDEDYSDEERDKCMDIDLFRRFSVTEHAAKLNPHRRGAGRYFFGNREIPKPDERVTRRRHSIATSVVYDPSKNMSSVH